MSSRHPPPPPRDEQYFYEVKGHRTRLRIASGPVRNGRGTWVLDHITPDGVVVWSVKLGEVMGMLVIDAMRRGTTASTRMADTSEEPALEDHHLDVMSEALSTDPREFIYKALNARSGSVCLSEEQFGRVIDHALEAGAGKGKPDAQ